MWLLAKTMWQTHTEGKRHGFIENYVTQYNDDTRGTKHANFPSETSACVTKIEGKID